MGRLDRLLRRTARQFAGEETVVASCLGTEIDGRRRRLVVLTDRRLMVTWVRGDPPTELARHTTRCTYQAAGGRLTLADGANEVALRDVAPLDGRILAGLLPTRAPVAAAPQRLLRLISSA